jgi:DNA-binding GntR family transcriptional regulator
MNDDMSTTCDDAEDGQGTLSEQIFQKLTDAIMRGELPAGAKISEPALARQYGVSRGPLREALHRLQERKLITRSANLGARVVIPTPQALHELFVVREALEGIAAREATLHATDAELAALRETITRLGAQLDASTQTPPYTQGSPDRDFHFRIAQASGNPMLIELLCAELYPLLRLYRGATTDTTDRRRQAVREHARLLSAMEERDADLAEMLMRRHIAAARKRRAALLA